MMTKMDCRFVLSIIILLVLFSSASSNSDSLLGANPPQTSYRLSFGSCFNHKLIYLDSFIFKSLAKYRPDSFVWLGDATYADTYDFDLYKYHIEENKEIVKKSFDVAAKNEDYLEFKKTTKRIYGIWDDHDYGIDNGGKNNPKKEFMREQFLTFLEEPEDSVRWKRKDGIYESYYLDPEQKIKLILLDNRFSKDEENE